MSASTLFDYFVSASTFRSIQHTFYQLCVVLDIDSSDAINVYRRLRLLDDWKAQKLWKLLDKKWELAEYKRQKAGELLNVLVIGAGPCGLRSAIECALLGSRVVLVEQRDRFSRNNVLHLWEFVIQDLKSLGAKIFYPKFCTGSIEHISIRQLQCILLKVALCFGVQIHDSVSFVQLIFPKKSDNIVTGFRASLEPKDHILSDYDIDVLIAADGKRNTVPGFPREEMRGKLAIGITANFVNNKTPAEERVPEISGVAYIFNQAFFKEMYAKTGVDLENIVYYKDDTHYFVMCAKKQSLLDMGVILKDNDDVSQLLSSQNVDQEALCRYAQSAADFATNGKLPALNFAKNHRGNEDVAMFDFTSLYSSKCSVRLVERMNKCLLMGIVGDSLHEPFWPTGSGCARGFLGVLDTAWLIREYGLNKRGPLEIIAERESIYRLLAQVTKDNMNKAISKYTIDPKTRYVSLESSLQPEDVVQIVSSDNPRLAPIGQPLNLNNHNSVHTNPALKKYSVWKFCHQVLSAYRLKMFDMNSCWNDGRALAGLVSKFRPDVLDYFRVIGLETAEQRVQAVLEAVENSMGIPAPCSPSKWVELSSDAKCNYIGALVDRIRVNKDSFKASVITPRAQTSDAVPKQSAPIQRLADNLMSCPSFRGVDNSRPKSIEELSASQSENVNPASDPRHIYKVTELKEENGKSYAKRPHPDRLNPDLVRKAERMVSGEIGEGQQHFDSYSRKNNHIATKSIAKNNTDEMEKNLENSGMGVLYNKKGQHISSQEEKILRTNAAHARKEAERGFSRGDEQDKLKNYDEKIAKSEQMMKRRDLAGVDPFSKWTQPYDLPSAIHQNGLPPASLPPPPPTKTTTAVKGQDGVVLRPVAPVQPKRHFSAPTVAALYESVNAKRQEICQLCEKVVYLAERMQVESMFVHKNCFRCAYCSQPLRIGECGKDKDLEYHYPRRFFCKTHLRLPLKEKIARIERSARVLEKNSERERELVVQDAEPVISDHKATLEDKDESLTRRSATLSFFSPEQIRNRTVQRIREGATAGDISPLSEIAFIDDRTPERAEFSNHLRKASVASSGNEVLIELDSNSLSSTSDFEDELEECGSPPNGSGGNSKNAVRDEDDASISEEDEEEDELGEGDLEELERTVLQYSEENPERPLTQAQARSLVVAVIENINKRRNSQLNTPRASADLLENGDTTTRWKDEFYTPAQCFSREDRSGSDGTTSKTPSPPSTTTITIPDQDIFVTPLTSTVATDIRKKKAADLERLRTESRLKARKKTDEELGLEAAKNGVTSVAQFDSSATKGAHVMNEALPLIDQDLDDTSNKAPEVESSKLKSTTHLASRQSSAESDKADNHVDANDVVHSESRKETNILGNALRRFRMRRAHSKGTPSSSSTSSPCASPRSANTSNENDFENREVPCAAVAPSPRLEKDEVSSPSRITVNERNIRLFHRRAEKIRRQHDDERRRGAQEIQRGLQECEIRLDEIKAIGQSLELKLVEDPRNIWAMDSWFALVHENELLKSKEEMLRLSKREVELEVKYKDLNMRFKQLGEGMNDNLSANSDLLAAMLAVVEEKKEVNRLCENAKQSYKKINADMKAMKAKGCNFERFKPVFSSQIGMHKKRRSRGPKRKARQSLQSSQNADDAVHTFFDDFDEEAACDESNASSAIAGTSDPLKKNGDRSIDATKKVSRKRARQTSRRKRHKFLGKLAVHNAAQSEEEERAVSNKQTLTEDLVDDLKRIIVDRLRFSPALLCLSVLSRHWNTICMEQVKRGLRGGRGVIDVERFFRNENPFMESHVKPGEVTVISKEFLEGVRRLVRMLQGWSKFVAKCCGEEVASDVALESLTPQALGWFHLFSDDELPKCPPVLQEKLRDLYRQYFGRSARYAYYVPLMSPSMFIQLAVDNKDSITSLNLGEMDSKHVQPSLIAEILPNLEEFTWHNASSHVFEADDYPRLKTLSLTFHSPSSFSQQLSWLRASNLEKLYSGLQVPDDPTRFDMDVLLRSYQAAWCNPVRREEGEERSFAIGTLPKLRHIGFWNAPERLFVIMAKQGIGFETLQFGQLNQSLTRLCSLDSILQALFKFNQPKYEIYKLDVSNLKMYLHAMPVVSLDYYLPQLMMAVNQALRSIRSLELFVRCCFSASMPSSWVLEDRPKNFNSNLKHLTHFSLHIDGYCVFNDLNCHLPPSIVSVSISVSLPSRGSDRCISSLLDFIRRLANVNAYPELEDLHLQVWGVRCAERLLNTVADRLSDIRRLSIIAMPLKEDRDRLVDLLRHVASTCHRLQSLQLSTPMMRLLVEKYGDLYKKNWKLAIACVGKECELRDSCELGVGALPRVGGWDEYVVEQVYPQVYEQDDDSTSASDSEEKESTRADAEDSDSRSDDSFVADEDDDVRSDGEEDELDLLEKKLEGETNRRHERYLRKKVRQHSTSSEEEQEQDDEEDDSDVVYITDNEDEEEHEAPQNPWLDNEAEEVESGMESEDGSDTEPEGENLAFSSDEEMLEAAVEMVNARPVRNTGDRNRRKRIIESDSD
ncbi:hypothetical protein Q1695_011104 [Nippostrongylus brasiliensis]|nr:hypothetical protein Q1695_011104 [Nippostrongylus brasiliensis]